MRRDMITKSSTKHTLPVGPVLLTPEIFKQHQEAVIQEMRTKALSKTVGELLYRIWPYRIGEHVPAGLVMPLRVSLRRDYMQWIKPQYFLRPVEGSFSRGLAVEIILVWEPSDRELDLLSDILAPHATEFAFVSNCILSRVGQPKYALLHAGLTASVLRDRVLRLLSLVTMKALLLRSRAPAE